MKNKLSIENVIKIVDQDDIDQAKEYDKYQKKCYLEDTLASLTELIHMSDFKLVCNWVDNYGRTQIINEPFEIILKEINEKENR